MIYFLINTCTLKIRFYWYMYISYYQYIII